MVYLPDRNDPEAKLIISNLKAGAPECLPEGAYHIVSTLMDVTPGIERPDQFERLSPICGCRRAS